MKSCFVLLIFVFYFVGGEGQVKKSSGSKPSGESANEPGQNNPIGERTDTIISLSSVGDHSAKSAFTLEASSNQFKIADPILIALAERAKGNQVFISKSGIVGMPKRAYGFAKGHILLCSTVATSSGSTGGTASVGTGGSISGPGSSGPFIGMNGKSSYTGHAMWGNTYGMTTYSILK